MCRHQNHLCGNLRHRAVDIHLHIKRRHGLLDRNSADNMLNYVPSFRRHQHFVWVQCDCGGWEVYCRETHLSGRSIRIVDIHLRRKPRLDGYSAVIMLQESVDVQFEDQ